MEEVKIIQVDPYFIPDYYGGIEVHVYELSKQLIKLGHEVIVYTCSKTPKNVDGIEVRSFWSFDPIPTIKIGNRLPVPGIENPCPSPSFIYELKREKADIIHLHGQEFITSLFGFQAARLAKVPCVLTMHNSGKSRREIWFVRILDKILYNSLFKTLINCVDAVVVPTGEAYQVIRKYKLKPRRLIFIPHPIDFSRFRNLKQSQDYVLYVGRLLPVKGPEWLIKAIPLILKEIDTTFVLAGEGYQRLYLERLARKLRVDHHIIFLGSIPYEEVPQVMSRASVFVAPGNAGYTLLEAGALGKPIVSVDLEWNTSCLGKDSAIFVPPRDVRELAKAIVKILKNPEIYESLSRKVRDYIYSTRSWDTTIKRYVKLYESLIEDHKRV